MTTTAAAGWWWIIPLASFLGGSVVAWGLGFIVTNWVRHPVISVCLSKPKGSHVEVTRYHRDEQGHVTHTNEARYLRLHIENTGLSSIKDCCGYITKITREDGKGTHTPQREVLDLGWSHRSAEPRDIPRGAYLHMDVASLHLLPPIPKQPPTQGQATPTQRRWELDIGLGLPSSMSDTISGETATYDIDVLVVADNALPRHNIKVRFVHDPAIGKLDFTPFDAALFPWWAFQRRRASKREGVA